MFATIKLSDKDDMGKHETRRQHDMTDGHFTRRRTPDAAWRHGLKQDHAMDMT
jgi:hypothetical protein